MSVCRWGAARIEIRAAPIQCKKGAATEAKGNTPAVKWVRPAVRPQLPHLSCAKVHAAIIGRVVGRSLSAVRRFHRAAFVGLWRDANRKSVRLRPQTPIRWRCSFVKGSTSVSRRSKPSFEPGLP
jgi:hypothetical protein